eukprot:1180070-Prorocentrum_minimum.AAC.2
MGGWIATWVGGSPHGWVDSLTDRWIATWVGGITDGWVGTLPWVAGATQTAAATPTAPPQSRSSSSRNVSKRAPPPPTLSTASLLARCAADQTITQTINQT